MFSGIVEKLSPITSIQNSEDILRLQVQRPDEYTDLSLGDSIAVDGVCLTIEELTPETIQFALARETLRLLSWASRYQVGTEVNLERSLRFGDRVHGHIVTGHVDTIVEVLTVELANESSGLCLSMNEKWAPYIWSKGSVCLNGVSLTINSVNEDSFEVWLIPETMKRTNLGQARVGSLLHLEVDNMARGILNALKHQRQVS